MTHLQQECPGSLKEWRWEDRPCPLGAADRRRLRDGNEPRRHWGNTTRNVTTITLPQHINFPIENESSTVCKPGRCHSVFRFSPALTKELLPVLRLK